MNNSFAADIAQFAASGLERCDVVAGLMDAWQSDGNENPPQKRQVLSIENYLLEKGIGRPAVMLASRDAMNLLNAVERLSITGGEVR